MANATETGTTKRGSIIIVTPATRGGAKPRTVRSHSGGDDDNRSVASRTSRASVAERVAALHTELQDSVCVRRLVVVLALLALGLSAAVSVYMALVRSAAARETAAIVVQASLAAASASANAFFTSKYDVHATLKYAIESGWYSSPMDAAVYDAIIVPSFVTQPELMALYGAHSTKNTIKFSAELENDYFTELRWYYNSTYQARQRRVRSKTADIRTYTANPWQVKAYDPTERSWYKLGNSLPEGDTFGWEGPSAQTTHAAGDLSVPVFSMVFKLDWPTAAGGGFSVFRLKFNVAILSSLLRSLDVGAKGNAYIVNGDGLVVGARDASQVVNAEGDFVHIWEVKSSTEPILQHLNAGILEAQGSVDASHCDDCTHSAHVRSLGVAGWSLVVVLDETDFLVDSRSISGVAAILAAISIGVLAINFAKQASGLLLLAFHRCHSRRMRDAVAAADAAAEAGDSNPIGEPSVRVIKQTSTDMDDLEAYADGAAAARPPLHAPQPSSNSPNSATGMLAAGMAGATTAAAVAGSSMGAESGSWNSAQ